MTVSKSSFMFMEINAKQFVVSLLNLCLRVWFFAPQHEDFLLALQMNEEQYQKVV